MRTVKGILFGVASIVACVAAADIVTEPIAGGGTALVVTGTAFTADEAAALNANSVQELHKSGGATLVATGIASFTGTIRVKGGVYKITESTGWGDTAGKLYVEDGGTFYISSFAGNENKEVHVAGAGSGSYAALVKNGCALKLVMDADATIAFLGNWDTIASALDMGEHTLTVGYCGDHDGKRSECVWPNASKITHPGHLVIDGTDGSHSTRVTFTYNSDQMQGTNHTITVRHGSLDWYEAKKNSNWTLICEANTQIGYAGGSGSNFDSMWSGPIEVKSGVTLNVEPNTGRKVTLNGPLSGSGTVSIGSTRIGNVYFNGTNTAFAGKLVITKGTLHVNNEDGLNAAQAVSATFGATAAVVLESQSEENPAGFTAAKVKGILDAKVAGRICVGVGAGEIFDYPYALPGDTSGYLGSYGPGTVRVNAAAGRTESLRFAAQTNILVTAGDDAATRVSMPTNIAVVSGRVTMADAGVFAMGTGFGEKILVGGTLPPYPELVVTGQTVFARAEGAASPATIYAGRSSGTYGRVEFQTGAVSTNDFAVSSGSNEDGVTVAEVIQRKGSQVCWTRSNNDVYFGGVYSACSYVLDGGTLTCNRWLHLSSTSGKRPSVTVFRIEDGLFSKTAADFHLGWGGGTTILHQTGGLFTFAQGSGAPTTRLLSSYWNASQANGGWALMAVDGPEARSVHANAIIMAETSNSVSHVALKNGGTLTAPAVIRQNRQANEAFYFFDRLGNKAYLHFDGGVFQANWSGKELFGTNAVESAAGNWRTAPDRVAVYEGGAVIDSSNKYVHVSVPLEAPQGLGVKAITLPDGYDSENWYGGINVQICGEGEGASAVALYDSVKRRLTGVRVISSGWGYKEGTTSAIVSMGGKANAIACTVTLGETTDGGLVKRGSGTLNLKAANTFTGPVRVETGTLLLSEAGSLPYAAPLTVLADATLDAEGKTFTPASFTCAGTVKADVTVGAAAKLAFSSATLGETGGTVSGTLTVADGATLKISDVLAEKRYPLVTATTLVANAAAITVEMADGQPHPLRWILERRGNTLSLGYNSGTHIIFR